MSNVYDYLDEIVGAKLSAITFVLDYYQFQFDGPMFNVLTPVTVDSESGRAVTGVQTCALPICTLPKRYKKGGVALAEISKRDGRILRVAHGK